MKTIKDEFVFKNIDEMVVKFATLLNEQGKLIEAASMEGKRDYKSEIVELTQAFYCIEDASKVFISFDQMRQTPFWTVSECLTELLAIDPPVMDRYKPEIMNVSYDLKPNRKARYLYGNRWNEFDQLHNTFKKFKKNPTTKKGVITIFEGYDTNPEYADVPCTTQYHLIKRDGRMDMTTFFRSHDFFSGLKYDVFLSSFVLRSMCSWLKAEGVDVTPGSLYFYDNSLHYYPKKDSEKMEKLQTEIKEDITSKEVKSSIISSDIETYYKDLWHVKDAEEASYWNRFDTAFEKLALIKCPMFRDFARIYVLYNSRLAKLSELEGMVKDRLECEDIKEWVLKGKKY